MKMPGRKILNLETRYLLFCLFLAGYYGPYTVHKRISDVNYIINTPGRRKQKQLCHINMLKEYIGRDNSVVTPINSVPHEQSQMDSNDMNFVKSDPSSSKLQYSDILKDLDQNLSHLDLVKRNELKQLILEYEQLCPDIPTGLIKSFMMLTLTAPSL